MASDAADARIRTGARRRTLLSFATFGWRGIAAEVQRAGEGRIVSIDAAPAHEVALVLGARVRNGRATAVLEDRVLTAIELVKQDKAKRLLLSGLDDELAAMREILGAHAIAPESLIWDPQGLHTFESIHNAHTLGHHELLIVSQAFHLPRSLFLADRLGLKAVGVSADRRPYANARKFAQRETFSSVLAYWMTR
ncbi:MAG: YdcF family protein [Deltaproteobacteria bacterium]|nr:YdcF family protein [Deltaproteobacteria bacterium]